VSRRISLVLIACIAGLLWMPPAGAIVDGFFEPVVTEGRVFPVARSKWYSVIAFSDDWDAPRYRRVGGRWRLAGRHQGTDILAEPGTPVYSITSGRVERLGWLFYSGWRVGIRDEAGRYWFYAHLQEYAPGLSEGDLVTAGTVLGEVGNTGYGSRPGHRDEFTYHLHVGIQEPDGEWVNPYPELRRLYNEAVEG
jgi:murein DD-endopeptidase MepM/ murein hydrolase activator NlpD